MSTAHALPHALPSEMGISPKALLELLDAIQEKQIGLHGLTLLRHGHIIAEGWWDPYGPQLTHMLFSLSKSFTSTAVGFAVQEGLLSVEDPVVKFFPEKLPCRPCENMEKLKVKHVLTMSTGHNVEPPLSGEDWVSNFITSYLPTEPGDHFLYNTAGTYLLSAIVQKVTGQKTGDYLKPRLFDPLGIEDWWWEECPQGIHTGGFGLNIHTGDIAKFGQFLLQKGMWEGKQLLNPQWIETAGSNLVKNFGQKDWGMGYGYQFWQCMPEGVFRGDGACGQLCVVLPKQDMVIAVNAGLMDMQEELDVFWENLLPAVQEGPLPADPEAQAELERRLAALSLPLPKGEASCETAAQVSGRTYQMRGENQLFQEITFTFGEHPEVALKIGDEVRHFPIGFGQWVPTQAPLDSKDCRSHEDMTGFLLTASAGAWENGVYHLTMVQITTPFVDTFHCTFEGNAIIIDAARNTGLGGPLSVRMIGRSI